MSIGNNNIKLFRLSKYEPIGLLIFGDAEILRYPWETLIKLFRSELGSVKYDTVKDYADKLIEFIEEFFKKKEHDQQCFFEDELYRFYNYILREQFPKRVESELFHIKLREGELAELSQNRIRELWHHTLAAELNLWESSPFLAEYSEEFSNQISTEYKAKIDPIINYFEFQSLKTLGELSQPERNILTKLAGYYFSKKNFVIGRGIIITGFGKKEAFPSLCEVRYTGVFNGKLNYKYDMISVATTLEDDSYIIPFGQTDVISQFLSGYNSQARNEFVEAIQREVYKENESKALDPTYIDSVKNEWEASLFEKVYKPVKRTVKFLPKEELAEMAEFLITLTSIKRKVSFNEIESVGGPVDIAVISKGDGFVWVKRKHYFRKRYNHHYFHNYFCD